MVYSGIPAAAAIEAVQNVRESKPCVLFQCHAGKIQRVMVISRGSEIRTRTRLGDNRKTGG
jgi:hypothetical protein